MRFKTKTICNNNKPFLRRLSIYLKKGRSIKFHWITDDDVKPHTHPWDFASIILFGGYKERNWLDLDNKFHFEDKEYGLFSVNRKDANTEHLVRLRRLFGFKIPALTVGLYGEKKQLCSLCKELGYCKSNKNG